MRRGPQGVIAIVEEGPPPGSVLIPIRSARGSNWYCGYVVVGSAQYPDEALG